jgi:subtilisin family serine protease
MRSRKYFRAFLALAIAGVLGASGIPRIAEAQSNMRGPGANTNKGSAGTRVPRPPHGHPTHVRPRPQPRPQHWHVRPMRPRPVIVEEYMPPPPPPAPRPRRARPASGGGGGAASAGEQRFVPDEVVIEVVGIPSSAALDALARRHRLNRIAAQRLDLTASTLVRWSIPDGRPVREVVRRLAADRGVRSAQPNYVYRLQQDAAQPYGDPAQYVLAKLRLPQAHALTQGERVAVAVIDSGIDTSHPELAGAVAETFDALGDPAQASTPASPPASPHAHGTGIAGAIVAHARLMGVAPRAQVLAVRAFNPSGAGAQGNTFGILTGMEWALGKGARVINMSFAGPKDPLLARALAAAHGKGVVLIAAMGNAGAASPPLFPAADPNVIAVSATDAQDKIFAASNRGAHVALSAPGVDILAPAPGESYQVVSGTSFAAAHVSGIAALILERNPGLSPDGLRRVLFATAKDLGPKGRDKNFGFGMADAYRAVLSAESKPAGGKPAGGKPVEAISSNEAAGR